MYWIFFFCGQKGSFGKMLSLKTKFSHTGHSVDRGVPHEAVQLVHRDTLWVRQPAIQHIPQDPTEGVLLVPLHPLR